MRQYLLVRYDEEKIHQYMEIRRDLIDRGLKAVIRIPSTITDKIDALVYVQRLAALGKTEGMKAYLGEIGTQVYREIVLSERQSVIGRKKKGTKGALRAAIERIEPENIDELLDILEGETEDRIEVLYAAEPDPINIHAVEVFREEGFIQYIQRNGKEKKATIKTLQNILSFFTLSK